MAVTVTAAVTVTRPRPTADGSPLLGLGASDELGEHREGDAAGSSADLATEVGLAAITRVDAAIDRAWQTAA